MENQKITPPTMTRTEYVVSNLIGVSSPVEFSVAEKMALKRLSELEKIVKGISAKWIKNKTDQQMIDQTRAEMGRIKSVLEEKRSRYKVI